MEQRLDDVAQLFVAGMKDPAHPTACARVLCGCLQMLDELRLSLPYALDVKSLRRGITTRATKAFASCTMAT